MLSGGPEGALRSVHAQIDGGGSAAASVWQASLVNHAMRSFPGEEELAAETAQLVLHESWVLTGKVKRALDLTGRFEPGDKQCVELESGRVLVGIKAFECIVDGVGWVSQSAALICYLVVFEIPETIAWRQLGDRFRYFVVHCIKRIDLTVVAARGTSSLRVRTCVCQALLYRS